MNTEVSVTTALSRSTWTYSIYIAIPGIYMQGMPAATEAVMYLTNGFLIFSFLFKRLTKNAAKINPIINPPVGESIAPIPLLPPENTGSPTMPSRVYSSCYIPCPHRSH